MQVAPDGGVTPSDTAVEAEAPAKVKSAITVHQTQDAGFETGEVGFFDHVNAVGAPTLDNSVIAANASASIIPSSRSSSSAIFGPRSHHGTIHTDGQMTPMSTGRYGAGIPYPPVGTHGRVALDPLLVVRQSLLGGGVVPPVREDVNVGLLTPGKGIDKVGERSR